MASETKNIATTEIKISSLKRVKLVTNLVASVAANIIRMTIAQRPIHVLHEMYSISINSVIYIIQW